MTLQVFEKSAVEKYGLQRAQTCAALKPRHSSAEAGAITHLRLPTTYRHQEFKTYNIFVNMASKEFNVVAILYPKKGKADEVSPTAQTSISKLTSS